MTLLPGSQPEAAATAAASLIQGGQSLRGVVTATGDADVSDGRGVNRAKTLLLYMSARTLAVALHSWLQLPVCP